MKRFLLAASFALLGCSDGDKPGAADAGPDAASPLIGSWRLTSATLPSGDVPAPNGWLEITPTEYALGTASPGPEGLSTTYTQVAAAEIMLGDGTLRAIKYPTATSLRLQLAADVFSVYERATATTLTTIPLSTSIAYAEGAAPMVHPRAALIFLARSQGQVVFVNDTRDDHPLSFSGSSVTIDFSRDREALGTERITFGQRAGIAIGMVVVYDDRDESGTLDNLFTPCTAQTKDCIRGLSRTFLGYRDGTSAELSASPYAFLRTGWSHAVASKDDRAGSPRTGLLSIDPATAGTTVSLPGDAATVKIPDFKL